MVSTVFDSKTIKLQDGKEVTLVPCSIGHLKKFMKAWGAFAEAETEEDAFEIYINCCGIALEKQLRADFTKGTLDAETVLTEPYREYLEDVLDMPTIHEVLEKCGGLKMNDPKLAEAVEKALAEQGGTN